MFIEGRAENQISIEGKIQCVITENYKQIIDFAYNDSDLW